ncbi:MAG: LytR family transcriptional regulator [Actinomyces ruminicola]|uniref:LytR cell envelope-related transcriptional attenuator n=1 Tax=Actinomyces ruminicola TaxID=332524 RepID=A0A1H0ECC7_9ACTO|nr:LytR C-terminal domain-containing protein [Actinomyces ruminicola]MBE6482477.1 LytR family transcriptional regulator [Actinomyces ruminicola]SDN80025.1 LytR cell envelope-related transcriptional attenuator [Actinomyces ruminicola]
MSSSADPNAEYRRRLKHRQTIVIGGVLTVMAAVTVVCLMVWSGILPAPYDPGFSAAEDDTANLVQPCPPADATTAEITSIPVNVYNGTDTTGLAGGVADTLEDAGLTVNNTADWPKGDYSGEVQLTTSKAGLANAYTLAHVFTGSVIVQIDETQDANDPTVSVVLGDQYSTGILSVEEIGQLKAGETISAPTGCVAATTVPEATDSAEDAENADG